MKPLLPVAIALSLIWLLGGSWWLSGKYCGSDQNQSGFSVTDGKFHSSANETFSFAASSPKIIYTKNLETNFKQVGGYMKKNPSKSLLLTGFYLTNETNKTEFENLGIARAESIKKILVKNGASEDVISTKGIKSDNNLFLSDSNKKKIMFGGVNFLFSEGGSTSSNFSSQDNSATASTGSSDSDEFSTMILYFEDEQTTLEMKNSLEAYFTDLQTFINSNPQYKVLVSGHTDGKLSSSKQKDISKKRASNVRRLLRNFGFPSTTVVAEGKAASDPLGDDSSDEGKAKNNRAEIKTVLK